MQISKVEVEYRGLCKNRKTQLYDSLFSTYISALLCKNRVVEKAMRRNEFDAGTYDYDIDVIVLQQRTVETHVSEWAALEIPASAQETINESA